MQTLTKEIFAKALAEAILTIIEEKKIDFSNALKSEGAIIAREVQEVLFKYGFDNEHEFDEATDFKAIEEIVSIYEKHNCTGGVIHDFG